MKRLTEPVRGKGNETKIEVRSKMSTRNVNQALAVTLFALAASVAFAETPATPDVGALPLAAAATNIGPRIQFATPAFDFGKIKGGETAKHDFIFTNTGDALLEIKEVR